MKIPRFLRFRVALIACAVVCCFPLCAENAADASGKAPGVLESAGSAADQETAAPQEVAAAPAPSTLAWWNREIVIFRSTTASLSPAARSADGLKRIDEASDQLLEHSVTTEHAEIDGEAALRFLIGETYLFSLLSSDLDELAGQTLAGAAGQVLANLEEVRQARIEQGSAEAIAKGATAALIATAIFVAALFALRFLSHRISGFVERRISAWRRLRLARTDLRPHIGLLGKQFIRVLAFFIGIYLFCIWVAFSFNQFPLTEPLGSAFTARLAGFGGGLLKTVVASIPGLITAALICSSRAGSPAWWTALCAAWVMIRTRA